MRSSILLWFTSAGLALALLLLVAPPVSASEETYLRNLSLELERSTKYLDEAGAAISACNDNLIACLQTPEPTAQRIDNATLGLQGVRANLTAMEVPPKYTASHVQLETGYQQVIDGFRLYAAGLRERDLDKLSGGADLVREGRGNVTTASAAILGRPATTLDLVLILLLAVIATAAALGVLIFFVGRRAWESRRERIRDEWATCPKCGEVLDQWWTYRQWQIRQWRSDHLKSHERDTATAKGSKDGGSP